MEYTKKDIRALKRSYKKGAVNIGDVLISPCISLCSHYRRGTAYFTSSALVAWVDGLSNMIDGKTKVDILCSPIIQDPNVIKVLEDVCTADKEKEREIKTYTQKIALAAAGYKLNPKKTKYKNQILAYLIANGFLEIRFAIPNDYDLLTLEKDDPDQWDEKLFHVKNGYFKIGDDTVGFDGSFNETYGGHYRNKERTQVFRSWIDKDKDRLDDLIEDIDSEWGDDEKTADRWLTVHKLSKETLEKIKQIAPDKRPQKPTQDKEPQKPSPKPEIPATPVKTPDHIWEHKKNAIEIFLEKKNGILEMATGTGKTSTALEIIRQLYLRNKIETIVICLKGTDLLNQWCVEIDKWLLKKGNEKLKNLGIFKSYDTHHDWMSFINHPQDSMLLISRHDVNTFKSILSSSKLNKQKTMILHDEVHSLGSPECVNKLQGTHKDFMYRLGLSATPEREYGKEGNKLIENEVGNVIYTYDLVDAIKDGVLCEFEYVPLEFELTENDRDRIKKVFKREHAAKLSGKPWSKKERLTELSKVTKTAERKPLTLNEYLKKDPNVLKSSIVYVLDTSQGDDVCNVIYEYTQLYKPYYSGVDEKYLKMLASGDIDCLVACTRLDEGIDIQSLKNIIIMSSNKGKLATVQRLGRCLRVDPNDDDKKAKVIDFIQRQDVEKDENTDQARKKWLSLVSKTKRVKK